MFGFLRNSLRFSTYVRSVRFASSGQKFLAAKQVVNQPTCLSISEQASSFQHRPSKIQLISPHSRKKNLRRRPIAAMFREQENLLPKVRGIARCESYDLCEIFEDEHLSSFYQVTFVDDDSEDVLHITQRSQYRISDAVKDAFVFDEGVIVAWNFTDEELSQLLEFLYPFEIEPYDPKLIQQETETMSFEYGTGPRISIKNDIINLPKPDNGNVPTHIDILDRFSVSHGLAASVKIGIWEQHLNDYAEPLSDKTKLLIQGNIPWNSKESLQKTGEFAALRQSINLNSSLLGTDFYWERDALERYYNLSKKYFLIDRRLRELNNRLDHCQQFVSMVGDMLTHRHSSRLEWIIILLIVVEVVCDLHDYYKSWSPSPVYIVKSPEQKQEQKQEENH